MSKLNLNHSPLKQPEGTVRFQLNVVTDLEHLGSDCNEQGNTYCQALGTPVGSFININRDEVVGFFTDNTIRRINLVECTNEILVQLPDFGFDTMNYVNYPITGTYRQRLGCQNIVYFFDGINRDKFINIDRLEVHQTNGQFDISKFEFNPNIVHPTINREILNNGGKLEYGNYNFSIEFLNQNEDTLFVSPVDINYTPITISNNEGALNLATNLPEIGGKPLSNKSIKLTITNIPEDAVLARIVVFRHLTGDGLTSDSHVVGELIPINGDTLIYTYRGFNISNGDYLVDKNEYLTPRAIYQSSLHGLQVNNRLVRYNLKETIRDYSNYQSQASKICCKYVVGEVLKNDPNFYLLNQTFLGGEIILPVINWVHADGSISNNYPLIGRAKNSNDEVIIDDIFNNGQFLEKWQLYDTSIKDATPIDGYVSSGEFGYYESDQLYSDPPNYCGSNYWGNDCDGNNLEGKPVRLFVVPDRSVEPHDNGSNIRPIGIWFDESTIEFPNNDVVGYYFSITIVNQSNIEAKGIGFNNDVLIPIDPNNPVIAFPKEYRYFSSGLTADAYYNFATGNYLLGNAYVNGTHISAEGHWDLTIDTNTKNYNSIFEDDLPYNDLEIEYNSVIETLYLSDTLENQTLDFSISIDPTSILTINGQQYQNGSHSNKFNYLKLTNNYSQEGVTKYLAMKNYGNPIPNIWSIQTRRITNLNETISFKGDNFISPLNIDNIMDVYGYNQFFFWQDSNIKVRTEIVMNFYIESKYNSVVRHIGTNDCNNNIQSNVNIESLFFNKIAEPYKDKFKIKESICPFFPGYNLDYSYIQQLNRYSTIGFTYDFCSECTGLYPHRIIFSPQSFSEDLADGYRINQPNDYVDIPANTGAIIGVDYKDNKLVIRTERSCYFLQPNPQQMETSESNVYIGTGDFLSIPPQELNITPVGYGGQQHKLDSINSPKALIWADRNDGTIHSLGGEYKLLSQDMEKWFIDELPTINNLIFGYDPYLDRLLMTGKDKWTLSYCFKEGGWKSWHSYIPSWYIYNASTFYSIYEEDMWKHNDGEYTKYYELLFPHVVEMIIKADGATFLPQSIIYHANTYDYSNGYEQDVLGYTYDQFLAYNDTQSTGFQNLILNDIDDVYWNPTTTHVKQVDRNYKISPLKDLATSSNIWTTNITPIKVGTQGYMDKLPLVDVTKPMVTIGQFRSKWIGVRLYFNNPNFKISLEYGDSNKQNSIR